MNKVELFQSGTTVAEQLAAYDRALQDSDRVLAMLANGRPPEEATVGRVYRDVALVEEALSALSRQYPTDQTIRERHTRATAAARVLKERQNQYTPPREDL